MWVFSSGEKSRTFEVRGLPRLRGKSSRGILVTDPRCGFSLPGGPSVWVFPSGRRTARVLCGAGRRGREGGGGGREEEEGPIDNKSRQNRDKTEQQQIETKSRQNRTTTNRDKSRQKKSSTTNRDKSRQKKIINNKSRQIETKNRTTTNRDKSGQKKIINNRSRRQHIEAKPRQKK